MIRMPLIFLTMGNNEPLYQIYYVNFYIFSILVIIKRRQDVTDCNERTSKYGTTDQLHDSSAEQI